MASNYFINGNQVEAKEIASTLKKNIATSVAICTTTLNRTFLIPITPLEVKTIDQVEYVFKEEENKEYYIQTITIFYNEIDLDYVKVSLKDWLNYILVKSNKIVGDNLYTTEPLTLLGIKNYLEQVYKVFNLISESLGLTLKEKSEWELSFKAIVENANDVCQLNKVDKILLTTKANLKKTTAKKYEIPDDYISYQIPDIDINHKE